jgi:protein HIRA/HIR1
MLSGPTEVMFVSGKQTQWLDYLPSPVLLVKATLHFCAVAMQDGCVNVYSHTGRRHVLHFMDLRSPDFV